MPHEYLSEDQTLRYRCFVDDPSPGELGLFFRMDAATVEHAKSKRRSHNRLGWSVQWGTIRMLGTFLSTPAEVPDVVTALETGELAYSTAANSGVIIEGVTTPGDPNLGGDRRKDSVLRPQQRHPVHQMQPRRTGRHPDRPHDRYPPSHAPNATKPHRMRAVGNPQANQPSGPYSGAANQPDAPATLHRQDTEQPQVEQPNPPTG